jgi:hypothetical protein
MRKKDRRQLVVAEGELSSNGLRPESGRSIASRGFKFYELLLHGGLSE